jgi:hypothetical protein
LASTSNFFCLKKKKKKKKKQQQQYKASCTKQLKQANLSKTKQRLLSMQHTNNTAMPANAQQA